jgi:hypothetical protein
MCAIDGEEHLIRVPRIAWPGVPPTQLMGIRLPELQTPHPDSFVGHDDPSGEQPLLDIAVAETEAEVQPDAMADDLGREAVVLVMVSR